MTFSKNPISVTYSDKKLRVLIEEYLTIQKHDFTFKSLCSYVLYRAMEEGKTFETGIYESNQLSPIDCDRITNILHIIIKEGRVSCESDSLMTIRSL